MDYTLINKYLAGTATETEVEEIFTWIESSSSNRDEFVKYKQAWALTARSNKNIKSSWTKVQNQTTRKNKIPSLYLNVIRYAALIIVTLGLGMVLQYILTTNNHQQGKTYLASTTINASFGQMTNLVLPDGTSVILNSGSTITYSTNFSLANRNVILEGEAFFDVAKDSIHPFTIETETIDFRVYGTSFNIEAYSDDKQVNTTLIEGSLGVISKKGNELVRLSPGENAKYEKLEYELFVNKVDTSLYTSWKIGVISFRNERLEDIARKIERLYNVKIVIRNKNLLNETYWGTILRNKPIDQILEVIKITASFEYEIVTEENQKTLIYWD